MYVHDLSVLKIIQKIWVMWSLQIDKFVDNWFINLSSLLKDEVYYLLIDCMTYVSDQDEFFFYDKCINIHDYIINKIYRESWQMVIPLSWLLQVTILWVIDFKRIPH